MSDKIRAVSLDRSHAFDTVWHISLPPKLSADGIQGKLESCVTNFLRSGSQRMAQQNHLISSPSQGWSAPRHCSRPPHIPNLHQWSHWLWKILFISLLMTPPSAKTSLTLQIGRQQPLPSFRTLTKITSWLNNWNMFFNPDDSHSHYLSEIIIWQTLWYSFFTILLREFSH